MKKPKISLFHEAAIFFIVFFTFYSLEHIIPALRNGLPIESSEIVGAAAGAIAVSLLYFIAISSYKKLTKEKYER